MAQRGNLWYLEFELAINIVDCIMRITTILTVTIFVSYSQSHGGPLAPYFRLRNC